MTLPPNIGKLALQGLKWSLIHRNPLNQGSGSEVNGESSGSVLYTRTSPPSVTNVAFWGTSSMSVSCPGRRGGRGVDPCNQGIFVLILCMMSVGR